MRRAIPSLDSFVFTPNGFATVGTQNLVAASKMRVDRLIGSMLTHRDDCIAAFCSELPGASRWLNSDQAAFFGATLFPLLGNCQNQCPLVSNSPNPLTGSVTRTPPPNHRLGGIVGRGMVVARTDVSAPGREPARRSATSPPRCSPPNQGAAHRLPA